MIHLFIDTNRYLALYGFPRDELTEIGKIVDLIKNKKITLYLPEQVENEFKRNREEYLFGITKRLERLDISMEINEIPNIPEAEENLIKIEELIKSIKETNDKINPIIETIRTDLITKIKKKSFQVDKTVGALFSLAKKIPWDEKIIQSAIRRFKLDIPPGKKGSYGDAVIWESLLGYFPKGEDLYFVGFDKDFKSKVNDEDFSPYLLEEWQNKKTSNIIPFKHLGDFIKQKLPEIKKSDEIIEKEHQINDEFLLSHDALNRAVQSMITQSKAIQVAQEAALRYAEQLKAITAIPRINIEQMQAIKAATRYSEELAAISRAALAHYPFVRKPKKEEDNKEEEK